MSTEKLTQEEIDRMMSELTQAPVAASTTISQMESDIIGEVGNISMSQAATTLSEILGHKVHITTPQVFVKSIREVIDAAVKPKIITSIGFKKGLTGNNLLLMDAQDSVIIANLMMGGDGQVTSSELTELELSAVGEAMNQMMGSSATAMATMLGKMIDILPPEVHLVDDKEHFNVDIGVDNLNADVCLIAFQLEVEGILQSEIMHVFTMDAVKEITEIMLADQGEVLAPVERKQEERRAQPPLQPEADVVPIQKPAFQELHKSDKQHLPQNLELILDVPLEFSVMLGESKKTIKDILSLGTGSVVELNKLTEEPLSIYVNGKRIAEGEVVVINENFGIRITNILSKEKRIETL